MQGHLQAGVRRRRPHMGRNGALLPARPRRRRGPPPDEGEGRADRDRRRHGYQPSRRTYVWLQIFIPRGSLKGGKLTPKIYRPQPAAEPWLRWPRGPGSRGPSGRSPAPEEQEQPVHHLLRRSQLSSPLPAVQPTRPRPRPRFGPKPTLPLPLWRRAPKERKTAHDDTAAAAALDSDEDEEADPRSEPERRGSGFAPPPLLLHTGTRRSSRVDYVEGDEEEEKEEKEEKQETEEMVGEQGEGEAEGEMDVGGEAGEGVGGEPLVQVEEEGEEKGGDGQGEQARREEARRRYFAVVMRP